MYIRWAVYILALGLLIRVTDNWAHIGGLAGGFVVAYLAGTPRAAGSGLETAWKAAAWVAVFLTCVSFLKWYLWFARVS
jgi:rhomboid protease GluP